MALLACLERRFAAAAQIALYADLMHEVHGLVRRRPAEERMRSAVVDALDQGCGPSWRAAIADPRQPLDEEAACSLALGMRA
jgi:hypothetical protein